MLKKSHYYLLDIFEYLRKQQLFIKKYKWQEANDRSLFDHNVKWLHGVNICHNVLIQFIIVIAFSRAISLILQ